MSIIKLAMREQVDEKLESVEALLSSAQVQVQESIYELTNYLSKVGGDEESAAESRGAH